MSSKLLGIGGRLTSGKDTVADYLVEKHGWVKLNMSAPLHEAMLRLDPWIPIEFEEHHSSGIVRYSELTRRVGYTAAKENPEVRRLLQALGTDVGRKMFGENVWVNYANNTITPLREAGENVVITGIRFPNEIDMIHNNVVWDTPGKLVWVERPSLVLGDEAKHASESLTGEDFDITILNDGSLDMLYAKTEMELA